MKRLVICCDGTWNKPENKNVTNIEKIARTVETDPGRSGGVQQLVQYLSGVGSTGYWVDRVLGGAFGLGLFTHVTTAYRFLALNYEPGDQIFVFGFSRGAYTARSLVGMLTRVGLLTGEAVIENMLGEASDRYRNKAPRGEGFGSSNEEFRRDFCHPDLTIDFLGVFDTVGALGVPGALAKRHTFHDVRLSHQVACARHALAIDERRAKFEPSLWGVDELPDDPFRVKQVWFEGVHSDIGGGYDSTGLSDTTLAWMVHEAQEVGLVLDGSRLDHYVNSRSPARRHDSLTFGYRVLNLVGRLRDTRRKVPRFRGTWRRLQPGDARNVLLASSASQHYDAGEAYAAPNIGWFRDQLGEDWDSWTEDVRALPEPPRV